MSAAHVTVGLDGSNGAAQALDWALDYALDTGAEVDVVTVFHYAGPNDPHHIPSPRAARRSHDAHSVQSRVLDAALARRTSTPVVHRWVVPAPTIAQGLLRCAATSELLVLGSHGHGRVESALLGSVGADCLRWSSLPVVVVPLAEPATETGLPDAWTSTPRD